jgi:hypothetical protein
MYTLNQLSCTYHFWEFVWIHWTLFRWFGQFWKYLRDGINKDVFLRQPGSSYGRGGWANSCFIASYKCLQWPREPWRWSIFSCLLPTLGQVLYASWTRYMIQIMCSNYHSGWYMILTKTARVRERVAQAWAREFQGPRSWYSRTLSQPTLYLDWHHKLCKSNLIWHRCQLTKSTKVGLPEPCHYSLPRAPEIWQFWPRPWSTMTRNWSSNLVLVLVCNHVHDAWSW